MTQTPTISVIIPTLNEIDALPDNIQRLSQDPHIQEIVVVDGGSTDGTLEYLADRPELTVLSSEPGRGKQMNLAAQHARSEWLIFHHADSMLPNTAGSMIANLSNEVNWGGFKHRFSHSNWKLRLVSALHNFRCRQSGVVYGDQSMFVRRKFFWHVGGFSESGIEDLIFSDLALEFENSVLSELEVVTNSRKFRQLGEFRALALVVSIVWRYEKDRNIGNETFFNNYR